MQSQLFKVMTLNLRYNEPGDGENAWPYRLPALIEFIKKEKPLIFGTQEGHQEMLEELTGELDGYGWIGKGRNYNGQGEFNAIFYDQERVNNLEKGQFWLSKTPQKPGSRSWNSSFPRICTWGIFQMKNNKKEHFIIYNTHLDHESGKARYEGVKLIWEKISNNDANLRFILMGDFNAHPTSATLNFLKKKQKAGKLINSYTCLHGNPGATFHGFTGEDDGEPIDYIFVSPQFKIEEVKVVKEKIAGKYLSDHYPVVSKLNIIHNK